MNPLPCVSVVVTTRNEAANIGACLDSVAKQSYPPERVEVIVVDNASTDATKHIAGGFTQHVYDHGPERSAQRNFGIGKATGKYVLYLDADMTLSADVLRECAEQCEKRNFAAVYIPERIVGNSFWIKVRDFERGFYNATCIDCVRFVNKAKFAEIGGFDETMTGPEDWDFDRRINGAGPCGIIEAPIHHNEGAFDFARYLRKKAYYAGSFETYARKWGKSDPIIKKQLGFSYRYLFVFIEKGKWKRLLRHLNMAMAMYFLRFCVGFNYMRLRLRRVKQ